MARDDGAWLRELPAEEGGRQLGGERLTLAVGAERRDDAPLREIDQRVTVAPEVWRGSVTGMVPKRLGPALTWPYPRSFSALTRIRRGGRISARLGK